ncbi:glycosyltransferase family 2 protein [Hyphococcus sp.]|uniref:glycosyltransferase family 2 protein n=1 Tax=Hyphococcus sp. TaxID=2038636 RepID=UPI003CCBE3E4
MSQRPLVSVIIVNFNAGERLARCLDCLEQQSFTDFETIVYDNNSEDDSLVCARLPERKARIIRSPENRGFAAANNAAAREAGGGWIALLNPDAYPQPDWLRRLVEAAERRASADAFGSLQLDAARPDYVDGAGDVCTVFGVAYRGDAGRLKAQYPDEAECFAPCAAAALYRKDTFLRLGGFDESFFCYGEDIDFGFRLRSAGGIAVQVNQAVVLHEGSGVTGRRSAFTTYYGHRNRIWLYYKNMPPALYVLTAPLRILMDLALLAKYLPQGLAGTYLKAIFDGYKGLSKLNRKRKEIAAMRRESRARIAPLLCWSPIKTFRRSIDLRPIDQQGEESVNRIQLAGRK